MSSIFSNEVDVDGVSTFVGAHIQGSQEYVILYEAYNSTSIGMTYSVSSSSDLKHYIVDLEPGVYGVSQNGNPISSNLLASLDTRTLEFQSTGGGSGSRSGQVRLLVAL